MNRAEATTYLRKRYAWLTVTYPLVAEIPRDLYVRRNLRAAMALSEPATDHEGRDGTEIYTRS